MNEKVSFSYDDDHSEVTIQLDAKAAFDLYWELTHALVETGDTPMMNDVWSKLGERIFALAKSAGVAWDGSPIK